ncbi:MAG: CoA transferase [Zoogloeaceae bacterium]|nr:CoA transferase [Zoogloeaceae bacterium]
MNGPLHGIHIVEFESLGPGPLAGRILLGMGATVTLIARPTKSAVSAQLAGDQEDELNRGKQRIALDLKQAADREQAMQLLAGADALIEGNRPGVMERLGFSPAECARHNPKLVYGRMTGWGQEGPLAHAAGHDLNYVALTGLLSLSAHRGELPVIPPTMVGDAPGALGLAFGMVCALLDAQRSGKGRVVDAAIVDILAMLGGLAQWISASGQLGSSAPSPFHDSPFYDVYRCADGRDITIGALEPQFYALLLEKLGLTDVPAEAQYDTTQWPALKKRLRHLFAERSRDEWCTLLEGSDACFAPVLSLAEAARHPHNVARGNYKETTAGHPFGNPAPRFTELG